VSIKGSQGALRDPNVSSPDRFLQSARGQPSVAWQRLSLVGWGRRASSVEFDLEKAFA
jgi:hypothetical protein